MVLVSTSAGEVGEVLQSRNCISPLQQVQDIESQLLPEVVYTSYDGDNFSHHELIKQYCLQNGIVPIHPGSALGMYIATEHYGGIKHPIVEDCVSLIEAADRFYVMSDFWPETEDDIKELPEGVIAELVHWVTFRDRHVTYVSIKNQPQTKSVIYSKDILSKLDDRQRSGIEKLVKTRQNVRPLSYALSGDKYAKYAEWMMKDALERQLVPTLPYTLLGYSTLQLAYPGDALKQLLSRLAIAYRSHEISLYGAVPDDDFKLSCLPDDALIELQGILKLRPDIAVTYHFLGDVGVPKYQDQAKWAITSLEKSSSNI